MTQSTAKVFKLSPEIRKYKADNQAKYRARLKEKESLAAILSQGGPK